MKTNPLNLGLIIYFLINCPPLCCCCNLTCLLSDSSLNDQSVNKLDLNFTSAQQENTLYKIYENIKQYLVFHLLVIVYIKLK